VSSAGQDSYKSLHPAYYHRADVCVLVFDATRKPTYKNLPVWYKELRQYRGDNVPVLCAVNKIDLNTDVTTKTFAFVQHNNLPMYYVSASDGTNVVRLFTDAITSGLNYTVTTRDVEHQIYQELDRM
jgi:Rab-like protein 2